MISQFWSRGSLALCMLTIPWALAPMTMAAVSETPWECSNYSGEAQTRCINGLIDEQRNRIGQLEGQLRSQQSQLNTLQQQSQMPAPTPTPAPSVAVPYAYAPPPYGYPYGYAYAYPYPPGIGLGLGFGGPYVYGYWGPRYYGHWGGHWGHGHHR